MDIVSATMAMSDGDFVCRVKWVEVNANCDDIYAKPSAIYFPHLPGIETFGRFEVSDGSRLSGLMPQGTMVAVEPRIDAIYGLGSSIPTLRCNFNLDVADLGADDWFVVKP